MTPMVRQHFTERDILDLHAQGSAVLELGPDDRLTDVARERAAALGITIVQRAEAAGASDLHQKVRRAVIARLGETVDGELIDRVIRRVLQTLGKV
ncbi:MAG: hypothetical protein ACRDHY_15155 [Anaerolineales bacterium]